ncbi:MAG: haloacid dehalogenase-like hydrolase [Oscillospiraceae bacterium]|nr:haloacid dehalogenase-like hydrolase [Oscillospiraceae bacterium]
MNVYDFDGTIYDGDSTKDFFIFCVRRYPKICIILPKFFYYFIQYIIGNCDKERLKESFFGFLRLLPNTQDEVMLFWEKHEIKIQKWYLSQKRSNDVIISASPGFLLQPICEKLGISCIASVVNPDNGLYTGLNCYGNEKVRRFREIYIDASINCFYTDSLSDIPMVEIAQSAYIVKNGNVTKYDIF